MDIYRRYGRAILRKCERVLRDPHDAEDITQALFVDLLQQGRHDVDLPYLYRAATNRCLNLLRDRERRQRLLDLHGDAVVPAPTAEVGAQVISLDLLCRLFSTLDTRAQETVVYRYVDHMGLEEIAQLTRVSRRAISKRLAKARAQLALLSEGAHA